MRAELIGLIALAVVLCGCLGMVAVQMDYIVPAQEAVSNYVPNYVPTSSTNTYCYAFENC